MNSRALGMSKDKKSPPTTWVEFHLGSQNHFFVWRNKTDRPTIKSQVSPSLPQGLCCRSEEEKGHQKERNPIRNTTELDRASLEVPMILFSLSSIRLWIYRLQLSSIVIIINKKHSFFSCRQNLRLCCGLAHTSEPTCTDGPPVSVALVSPSPSGVCLRTLEEEPVSRRALHRYST